MEPTRIAPASGSSLSELVSTCTPPAVRTPRQLTRVNSHRRRRSRQGRHAGRGSPGQMIERLRTTATASVALVTQIEIQ